MDDSVPADALDPEEALSKIEKQKKGSINWSGYGEDELEVPDFTHAATPDEIILPSGTKYEVTFLVRIVTTETEQKLPSENLPRVDDDPTPPETFEEREDTYVVDRTRESCETCHGDGIVACSVCGGEGVVSCPRSQCQDGILKESCGCGNGVISKECRNCDRGRIATTVYRDGKELEDTEKCEVCNGDGELTDTCPQCAGSGEQTIGECNRCTQSDPVGMVDCDACNPSDRTEDCDDCDGHGELVTITREHHDYRIVTDTVFDTIANEEKYFEWEDTPENVTDEVAVDEFDDLSVPDGTVLQSRMEEYSFDHDRCYKLRYNADLEYDLPSSSPRLTLYVAGDSVTKGEVPVRQNKGFLGSIKDLIGL